MQKLRPLRVVLAGLVMIFLILAVDLFIRLNASSKNAPDLVSSSVDSSTAIASGASENTTFEPTNFIYLSDFLDLVEESLEVRLAHLGVPEEEYRNPGEYLDRDELFLYDTKVTLASELDENWVAYTSAELERLRTIFELPSDFSFDVFSKSSEVSEYKPLSDLLSAYETTLATVEDYDMLELEPTT